MKKGLLAFALFGIFFFTALAFISFRISFPLILPRRQPLNLRYYDYSGITHVHSALSTGSGNMQEISKAASQAGCDFIIITDLNQISAALELEGYQNDVLVLVGGEYGYLGGHILVYNLNPNSPLKGPGQNQLIFSEYLSTGATNSKLGQLVAAHPLMSHQKWDKLDHPGLSGMEILNTDSLWRSKVDKSKLTILWSLLILPFNSDLAYLRLYNDPYQEVSLWDSQSKSRPFYGFSGSDATANAIAWPQKSIRFPSYQRSFRLTQNHVLLKSELTGNFQQDKIKILDALAGGNFYFSVDLIGNPKGFTYFASQRGSDYLLGSTISKINGGITLHIDLGRDLPLPHEILLIKNGVSIASSNSSTLDYETKEAGSYRAVVRVIPTLPVPDGKRWFTWIYSNPIFVK